MSPVELHAEDQYAVVRPDLTLAELEGFLAASLLPSGRRLHYRAPALPVPVGDWALAGGVGILGAPPARADVLGLAYAGPGGTVVEAGGRVVKNVSGYDLVRLVVGSDPALERGLRLERLTLRLRPAPEVSERDRPVTGRELDAAWRELRAAGAAYAVAFERSGGWVLRATWWGAAPAWGEPVTEAVPAGAPLRDALGAFPREPRAEGELERRLRQAVAGDGGASGPRLP